MPSPRGFVPGRDGDDSGKGSGSIFCDHGLGLLGCGFRNVNHGIALIGQTVDPALYLFLFFLVEYIEPYGLEDHHRAGIADHCNFLFIHLAASHASCDQA